MRLARHVGSRLLTRCGSFQAPPCDLAASFWVPPSPSRPRGSSVKVNGGARPVRKGQEQGQREGTQGSFSADDREATGDHRGHRRDGGVSALPALCRVLQLYRAGEHAMQGPRHWSGLRLESWGPTGSLVPKAHLLG